MKLLILAANGQIARIVEDRILSEDEFKDVDLTLGLRNSNRLSNLVSNSRVKVIEIDLENEKSVDDAVARQDMVFVAIIDHDDDNAMTNNVIKAMKENHVNRVAFSNILGIYNEVPGEFGRWNHEQVKWGLKAALNSDKLLEQSGLTYTTLCLPWLNDRDEVKYVVTTKTIQWCFRFTSKCR
ncbi:oxidoreductase [Companilactobacillus nodensis DSM 19682 = JCM 14932 = NBRC 107160]|uniref:Oxidoreductase n=1 Tax=Companilactobacillus nodensis DSM 19682 = JCM 14932 = NBRC 107160 TaxID=1423775 RepID=A0A0R1KCN4_9LACO|nr:oxidoreductase [Companilactobacillus nodensis DSM 19682 = JCM 14932 = NBRC 107160]